MVQHLSPQQKRPSFRKVPFGAASGLQVEPIGAQLAHDARKASQTWPFCHTDKVNIAEVAYPDASKVI